MSFGVLLELRLQQNARFFLSFACVSYTLQAQAPLVWRKNSLGSWAERALLADITLARRLIIDKLHWAESAPTRHFLAQI